MEVIHGIYFEKIAMLIFVDYIVTKIRLDIGNIQN
jgi:hypothetical protein